MEKTIRKPSFREVVAVTTMNLDDYGLQFNAQRVGPMNFAGLRQANYGEGFRMPTMPELIPLVYASLENRDYATAKNVIGTLKQYLLTGNTSEHYFSEGMFVQDNPEMEDGRIATPDLKALEARLGSHEERGVIFSDDRKVRFTPYGFKREVQSALDLATNSGVIAFAGGEEKAEMLAKASEHYRQNPYFWTLTDVKQPQTRVAGLGSDGFDGSLDVGAGSSVGNGRYSFGVSEAKKQEAEGKK